MHHQPYPSKVLAVSTAHLQPKHLSLPSAPLFHCPIQQPPDWSVCPTTALYLLFPWPSEAHLNSPCGQERPGFSVLAASDLQGASPSHPHDSNHSLAFQTLSTSPPRPRPPDLFALGRPLCLPGQLQGYWGTNPGPLTYRQILNHSEPRPLPWSLLTNHLSKLHIRQTQNNRYPFTSTPSAP